jgi:hypothetical protein
MKKYNYFLENYKSFIHKDDEIKDLPKAEAIKDIMVDCPSYFDIKKYLNSLYVLKDNIYISKMFDSIVKAISIKVEERDICEIISSIYDAIKELDFHFDKRWQKSKSKNTYKRRDIRIYLESLVDGPNIDTSIFGWKEFIRKKLEHAKYEDSFTEENVFSKKQTQLSMGKLPIREYVFTDKIKKEDILNDFVNIIKSYKIKTKKADLVANMDIYNKERELVVNENDLIEVKYKNWKLRDTLGEFFAISKGHLSQKSLESLDNIQLGRTNSSGMYLITDIFKLNPSIFKKYNDLIESLYKLLTIKHKSLGNKILNDINSSYVGIMFKDNKFIKSEDIELKWSLLGQRKNENRLTITHEVVDNPLIHQYIDNPKNPHFRKVKK